MKAKNVCDLPAAGALADEDGILIMQGGKALKMTMPQFRTYILLASMSEDFGFPTMESGVEGHAIVAKEDLSGYEFKELAPADQFSAAYSATTAANLDNRLNTILAEMKDYETRVFSVNTNGTSGLPGAGVRWFMTMHRFSSTAAYVRAYSNYGNGSKATRVLKDAVWDEWEFENPYMQVGKEYRTTERYLGAPIYSQIVAYGSLPNATIKRVEHNIENIDRIIDIKLVSTKDAPYSPSIIGQSTIAGYSAGPNNITIETSSDMSNYEINVWMKYTKES